MAAKPHRATPTRRARPGPQADTAPLARWRWNSGAARPIHLQLAPADVDFRARPGNRLRERRKPDARPRYHAQTANLHSSRARRASFCARFVRRLSRVSYLALVGGLSRRRHCVCRDSASFCASRFKTLSVAIHASPSFPCSLSPLPYRSSRESYSESLRRGSQPMRLPSMRFEVWAVPRGAPAGRKSRSSSRRPGFRSCLLAAALLLMQSLRNMRGQNFGFETSNRYIAPYRSANGRI